VAAWDLIGKKPLLVLVNDLSFDGLPVVDYIHAQSVMSHMPREDLETCFKNVHKVMQKDTKFFYTFFQDTRYHDDRTHRNFFYPFSLVRELAARHNLTSRLVEDTPTYNKKQTLVLVTKT
jgi:hypothetical protein